MSSFDPKTLSRLPQKPGVYLMKDAKDKVLYVGKAKNLKVRVKQYFAKGGDGRPQIPYLVAQVDHIDTIIVHSEKEALLLENTLIKKHMPRYNVFLRDDKSYLALKINTEHPWPMVSIVRHHGTPKGKGLFFGPYTSAHAARKTLDFLQKTFPLRQCSNQELLRRTRPCILYDMKRCIAPCVKKCAADEYEALVKQTIQFLRGNDQAVLKELKRQMDEASDALQFERAGTILRVIQAIKMTVEKQRVDNLKGQDVDVIGFHRESNQVMVAVLIFKGGRLSEVRHHSFKDCLQKDEDLMESFLMQNYEGSLTFPKEIFLPFEIQGQVEIEELFSEKAMRKTHVLSPTRGEKKKLLAMAAENAKNSFKQHVEPEVKLEQYLLIMQKKFRLSRFPSVIECFDNSNLSGSDPVSAMVVFRDGKKESKGYRTFKIKEAKASDDYGSMSEVLKRRYVRAKKEGTLPDLLIVDGGKGQLNIAQKILEELEIVSVDLISLAKEMGRHDKGITAERVFIPGVKDPVILPKHSPVLFLLQRIRDEAHRFVITYQKKRRSKQIQKSILDEIEGVGPARKRALLKHFGSLKKMKEADLEEIAAAPGVSKAVAKSIFDTFSLRKREIIE